MCFTCAKYYSDNTCHHHPVTTQNETAFFFFFSNYFKINFFLFFKKIRHLIKDQFQTGDILIGVDLQLWVGGFRYWGRKWHFELLWKSKVDIFLLYHTLFPWLPFSELKYFNSLLTIYLCLLNNAIFRLESILGIVQNGIETCVNKPQDWREENVYWCCQTISIYKH